MRTLGSELRETLLHDLLMGTLTTRVPSVGWSGERRRHTSVLSCTGSSAASSNRHNRRQALRIAYRRRPPLWTLSSWGLRSSAKSEIARRTSERLGSARW